MVTFVAKVLLVACIRVCPSGVALASAVAALTVPSPTLDELQAFVKTEVVRWGKVLQEAGLAGSE